MGPSITVSYSEATKLQDNVSLSHTHDQSLPATENNNNIGGSRESKIARKSSPSVSVAVEKPSDKLKVKQNPPISLANCELTLCNELSGSATGNASIGVGDNTEFPSYSLPVDLPKHSHDETEETLMQVLAELKEIKSTTCKIPIIEEATFSKDLQGVLSRTESLESALEAPSTRVKELDEEVSTLEEVVRKQEESITSLKRSQEESSKSIDKKFQALNDKMGAQTEKLESLRSSSEHSKQEIIQVIDDKIDNKIASQLESEAQEAHFHQLREQAFQNRYNLVISGLPEDEQKSTLALVNDFLSSSLNITNVNILSATRLGAFPDEETNKKQQPSSR